MKSQYSVEVFVHLSSAELILLWLDAWNQIVSPVVIVLKITLEMRVVYASPVINVVSTTADQLIIFLY